jgi:hypothetical protein
VIDDLFKFRPAGAAIGAGTQRCADVVHIRRDAAFDCCAPTPSIQEAKNGGSLCALNTASCSAATVISPEIFKTQFL